MRAGAGRIGTVANGDVEAVVAAGIGVEPGREIGATEPASVGIRALSKGHVANGDVVTEGAARIGLVAGRGVAAATAARVGEIAGRGVGAVVAAGI